MNSHFFEENLAINPIIAILRGLDISSTLRAVEQCLGAGIQLVEVPIQDRQSCAALRAVVEEFGHSATHHIGAGTVCSAEDVRIAAQLGAEFVIAPGYFPEMLDTAEDSGLPALPGVATATEIFRAAQRDYCCVKLFPASSIGPSGIRSLRGPFPGSSFVAVGGIAIGDVDSYLEAGAMGVGIGAGLLVPGALDALAMRASR